MKPDYFKNLPSEIITDILSRLSVRTVAISKCVCKPWLDLLETDEFVKSHFSKSAPTLLVDTYSDGCKVFELQNEVNLESRNPLTMFDFPFTAIIEGSANGLLVLRHFDDDELHILLVSNPITREVIKLDLLPYGNAYGLGASKISGQHKVVSLNDTSIRNGKSECHVCTLGTGSWRPVEPIPFMYIHSCFDSFGAFLNGNIHWLVETESFNSCGTDACIVCCFDVETECFSTFSAPPLPQGLRFGCFLTLSGCLCFYEVVSDGYEFVMESENHGPRNMSSAMNSLLGLSLSRFSKMVTS